MTLLQFGGAEGAPPFLFCEFPNHPKTRTHCNPEICQPSQLCSGGTMHIYSDGSGGEGRGNIILRRCGWSCIAATDCELTFARYGPLVGRRRTVPRSETQAIVDLIAFLGDPLSLLKWGIHRCGPHRRSDGSEQRDEAFAFFDQRVEGQNALLPRN